MFLVCFPLHWLFTVLGPWDIKSPPFPISFLAERRRGVWKWLKHFSSWKVIRRRLEMLIGELLSGCFLLVLWGRREGSGGWEVKGRTRWLIGPRQQVSTGQLNQTKSRLFPPTIIRYIIWLCQQFRPAGCSKLNTYTCGYEEGQTHSQRYALTHTQTRTHTEHILVVVENEQ